MRPIFVPSVHDCYGSGHCRCASRSVCRPPERRCMSRGRAAIILGLMPFSAFAWAEATLLDGAQLSDRMKAGELCCVIDARQEGRRKQRPIPFAVTYREDLKLAPGGFAVVVADDDAKALTIAETLAAPANKPVYAVKGGYDVWRLTPEGLARPVRRK